MDPTLIAEMTVIQKAFNAIDDRTHVPNVKWQCLSVAEAMSVPESMFKSLSGVQKAHVHFSALALNFSAFSAWVFG